MSAPGFQLFAHYLRGPAAIAVVVSHFGAVYWAHQTGINRLIGARDIPEASPPFLWLLPFEGYLGQVGVGVFFLISGFVIANAIGRTGSLVFLGRRALRIYPTYWASFLVTIAAVIVTAKLSGGTFPYAPGDILVHLTILPREFLGFRMIDGVSWTLEVELAFYLLMALVGGRLLSGSGPALAGASVAAGLAGLVLTIPTGWDRTAVQCACLALLFCGCGFFLHERGSLSAGWLVALAALALAAPTVVMMHSRVYSAFYGGWAWGYATALAVFAFAYALRHRFSASTLADHLSAISYPLYASHIFVGYGILYAFVRLGWPLSLGVVAAFLAAYLVALAIHFAVEVPTVRWSKRFGAA